MNNLHTQEVGWYGFGLKAREHLLLPIVRTITRSGIPFVALLIQLSVFRPGIPGWSGNSVGRDIVSIVLFLALAGAVIWQTTIIWVEWLGKGVEYDEDVLTVYEPTSHGFGGPETQEYRGGRRQVEMRPINFPLNLIFVFAHLDDTETNKDQDLWWVSRSDFRWLKKFDSVNGQRKKPPSGDTEKKDAKIDKSVIEEGDSFKLKMLIMLIKAYGSEKLLRGTAYIISISEGDDNIIARKELQNNLVNAVQKAALPNTRAVDPEPQK